MRVLVTGAAGYIGSHMALALMDRGDDVLAIDDFSRGNPRLVPDGLRFVEASVADRDLMADLCKRESVDAVVHFAGYIVVPESVENPILYYVRNTAASSALIDACIKAGVEHFIFSSTAAVYGAPDFSPVPESAPTSPISPYGRSKLMTEQMLNDAEKAYGFRSVKLRYFNVAGADPQGRSGQWSKQATHLVKIACETAIGLRPELTVFGDDYSTADGTCIRDYVHVSDLVDAHVAALDHLRAGGAGVTLNCGYGRGASVFDVLRAMERVLGRAIPYRIGNRRPGDPAELVADPRRLKTTFDWTPKLADLDEICRSALAWEQRLQAMRV